MGLDIYFHKVKHARKQHAGEGNYDYYSYLLKEYENQRMEKSMELKDVVYKWIEHNKNNDSPWVQGLYLDIKRSFCYDYYIGKLLKAKSVDDVKTWADEYNWEEHSLPDAAYFRKANSLYKYFVERLNVDESCVVYREDVVDILGKAVAVLDARKETTSQALLPTCPGFCFGSTDYDDWYYRDIADVVASFGHILSEWRDEDIMIVHMSW